MIFYSYYEFVSLFLEVYSTRSKENKELFFFIYYSMFVTLIVAFKTINDIWIMQRTLITIINSYNDKLRYLRQSVTYLQF